ncbi:MAG: desulfoferrodoxin [Erysipelotrichia bacterium]|nr:desulfoferrodoxin [Erysipelotrichia bacterium]
MEKLSFYRCSHCGNVIVKVKDTGVPVVCCGEQMQEMKANSTDAAVEKHVPVIIRENNKITVTVGSAEHPMTEEHYIEFIALETDSGFRISYLHPGDKPKADFCTEEPVIAVYAYCNLHGLWTAQI